MDKICCIYIIINEVNEIYIGQTINFRRRLNSYCNFNKIRSQRRLKESFLKYGFENHKIEVLLKCEQDKLNFWEEFYISLFDTFDGSHGLNGTSGGRSHKRMKGCVRTEEWKKNISKSHLGKKRKEFSQEWRDNISKSHKGIKRTEEWLNNLKLAASVRKDRGGYIRELDIIEKQKKSYNRYLKSEKWIIDRDKISELTSKRFSIPIYQYSKDGAFIKEWSSMRAASRGLNISHPNLVNCANNKSKSAAGFVWRKEKWLN